MNAGNVTTSLTHIIMPLISFMSAHFLLNSFTFISDMEPTSAITFMKIASKNYLQTNHKNQTEIGMSTDGSKGYVVYDKPDFNFSKVVKTKPKLVVGVYKTAESTPLGLNFTTGLAIPPSVPFFVVLLHQENGTAAKCFRLYKPTVLLPPKSFPFMHYGGENALNWNWETEQTDWNSFTRETRNMQDVTVTIALASHLEKNIVIERFWEGKNSFFWKEMQEHLKFRERIHFHLLTPEVMKNITGIYLSLLLTVADGLGVLPVVSAERDQHVEFILTGLDSKYHIMVRTPLYIHSWQSIFKPFTSDSWLCLGCAILLITAALKIVTFCQKTPSSDLSSCFLTIFGFICAQSCPNIPKTLPARMICYTAIVFSILMYQFYTSNFYSLLSTKEVTLPFTSLEQFIARKTHSMYVNSDTAIYAHIVKAKSGPLKKLWDEFLSKDPSHQLQSHTRTKSFERVCKGKAAIFGLPFQTIFSHDLMCKLVTINSGYFPTNIATAVRKNFPFKSQFQFVHLRLLEAGVSHKYRDWDLSIEQHHAVKAEAVNEPVSLEHVSFLFAFHGAFVVFSWILLGVEIIASKIYGMGGGETLKKGMNEMP